MKRNRVSQSGLFNPRALLSFALCSVGTLLALLSFAATPSRTVSRSEEQVPEVGKSKIASWVLEQTANGKPAEFLIVLSEQADLAGAQALQTKEEKGRYVRDALWDKAQATQGPLLQWLRDHNVEYRSFYIVNLIWAKAGLDVAQALAARADVLRVEGNPQICNVLPQPLPANQAAAQPESTTSIEPGITYTRAPEVWALGYTGQGIVVGGQDTGYRWDHTVLKNKYRGWDGSAANHDYNWHDSIHTVGGGGSCGHDSAQPCDDNGHGTHTMGTAVGDDGTGNQVGMAPGAKWIGCRNMDQTNGTPATYMECFEFFLAPYPVNGTPAQGDPSKAPHVTTNSWSCPASEGCSANTLKAAVEAQRAAGIMTVVAAQNSGPSCSTVNDPPGIYDAVYSIGALNNGTDTIASFSSRGPVIADGSNRLKPDLCAPGTNVRSSWSTSTTSYNTIGGTSMATPHVAGAVALLWSAQPSLRNDVSMTETILNEAAAHLLSNTCDTGSPPVSPNNTYGFGRLDIKNAVDAALLRVLNISSNGIDVVVGFFGVQGRTYRLERKIDLDVTNPPWQSIPGVNDLTVSSTGPAQISDPGGGNQPHAFYHVRLLP